MFFEYKTLMLLRENTTLDPVSYFKVLKERDKANERQKVLRKVEHCDIGVDYTKADQLEANLRFEKWKNKINNYWLKYNSNTDFDEFALYYLNQQKPQVKKLMRK